MRVKVKLLIITLISFIGTGLLAAVALYSLNSALQQEKHKQIVNVLQQSEALLAYYHEQEQSGKLSRTEAQKQAARSLNAMRHGDSYYIVRDADSRLWVHLDQKRIGRIDDGGKTPDGRMTAVQAYALGLQTSRYAFADAMANHAGTEVKVPKLNGVYRFEPWGWIVGTGVFVDDIRSTFWHDAILLLAVGVGLLAVVFGLSGVMSRQIVGALGGEPDYAAAMMARIADGDLAQRIDYTGSEHSLLAAMSHMQQGLRQLIEKINASSSTLKQSAQGLAQRMQQLGAVSATASESTASAAASIEQLSVSIDQVRDVARHNETSSHAMGDEAVAGVRDAQLAAQGIESIAGQVHETSTMVLSLSESTRDISGIAATIRDIADQTNLLALNAAIEAARAGELGRGFAVVADEVRKLAERTASATSEITTIIGNVVAETEATSDKMEAIGPGVTTGVSLVRQAESALSSIRESIQHNMDRSASVSLTMNEQSAAGLTIARSVEHVANVVEETQRSVVLAESIAREIDTTSAELYASVGRFRL